MYLSKIELELSNRGYRAALDDGQKMHQLVSGLTDFHGSETDILYRSRLLNDKIVLYLYSTGPLREDKLLPGMLLAGTKDISNRLDRLEQEQVLNFDLLTMPSKKVAEPNCANSRRRVLKTMEERFSWLGRKAEQNGFRIISVQEYPYERILAKHSEKKGGMLFLDVYRYSGILQITDANLFRNAIRAGIGPGKAYGLGMILLKW